MHRSRGRGPARPRRLAGGSSKSQVKARQSRGEGSRQKNRQKQAVIEIHIYRCPTDESIRETPPRPQSESLTVALPQYRSEFAGRFRVSWAWSCSTLVSDAAGTVRTGGGGLVGAVPLQAVRKTKTRGGEA